MGRVWPRHCGGGRPLNSVVMRVDAPLVGMLLVVDDLDPPAVSFLGAESLLEFIETMAPLEVSFRCAPHEDIAALRALLVHGTLH